MNLEWAHALAGVIGALFGAAAGIFSAGWRLGRIEARLSLQFKEGLDDLERRIDDKVNAPRQVFDETLKGLRQKINDVELESEKAFLRKEEFREFREEYREDVKRIFDKLDHPPTRRP